MHDPSEVGSAVAILNACGVEMRDRHGVPDWLLPSIPGTLAADATAARLFVVTEAGEMIGTFALCDIPDDSTPRFNGRDPAGSAVYLHRFAISPKVQSKEIGARLPELHGGPGETAGTTVASAGCDPGGP